MATGDSSRKAVILALASVFFWAWAATAFKQALMYTTPWQVVFYGSLISAAALSAFLVFSRKKVSIAEVKQGLFFGFLNPFLYYLVLLNAYNGLPAQIAMVINYLWPVVLVVLAVPILHQKLTLGGISGILVSFAGVVLMALLGRETFQLDLIPLILAFFSTVVWAVYWLLNTRSKGDINSVLLVSFISGTVYLTLAGFINGESFTVPGAALPWLVYIGLFEMGVTYMMWNKALKLAKTTASIGSLIFLTPFLALIPIGLVVGESIAFSTVTGLGLVVAGIFIEKHFRVKTEVIHR